MKEKGGYEIIVTNRKGEFENFRIKVILLSFDSADVRKFRDILNFLYFRIIFTLMYRIVLKLEFHLSENRFLIKLKVNELTNSEISF